MYPHGTLAWDTLRPWLVENLARSHIPRFVIVLFLSLSLTALTFRFVWQAPFLGLYWNWQTGHVDDIAPDTPAAAAGVRVGDRVVAVNGAPLYPMPALSELEVGQEVVLTWQRGDELNVSRLPVLPYTPQGRFWQIEPLLIALLICLMGALVLALRPGPPIVQLFFFTSQVSSGVLCAGLLSAYGYDSGTLLFNVLLCWLAPLLVHFHLYFPERRPTPRWPLLLVPFYLAAAVLSVLSLLQFMGLLPGRAGDSWLRQGIWLLTIAALISSVLQLAHNYRGASSTVARRRIRLVVIGSFLALLPLVLFSLLPDLLGLAKLLSYQGAFLFLLLIPLAYSYAVWRYNLFNTDRILNRSIVYAALAFFWAGVYLLLVFILDLLFSPSSFGMVIIGALLVILMALTIATLQSQLAKLVDRVLYGGWYNTAQLQQYFSRALSTTHEWSYLSDLFVQELPRVMHARGAALFRTTGEADLRLWLIYGVAGDSLAPIPERGEIASRLCAAARPLRHADLRRLVDEEALTEAERALLARDSIGVWIPFLSHDRLELLLLLGRKQADESYTSDDLHLLSVLAHHAATSVQNIRLVQALQQQLELTELHKKELERAHHALIEAREEERKALAREVHDGPIQDIIGVSFHLRHYSRQSGAPDMATALLDLRQHTLDILDNLRRICANLRPPDLDVLGLAAAITSHVESRPQLADRVHLDLRQDMGRLPPNVAIALFRIYQEATQNALKHAQATQIWIQLRYDPESCCLCIRDDGCGFQVPDRLESFTHEHHFGLVGIKERADAIGARVNITSVPGEGTTLQVEAPLPG